MNIFTARNIRVRPSTPPPPYPVLLLLLPAPYSPPLRCQSISFSVHPSAHRPRIAGLAPRNQIVGPEASGSKLPAAAPRAMSIRCATSHYVLDIAQIAVQGPDI